MSAKGHVHTLSQNSRALLVAMIIAWCRVFRSLLEDRDNTDVVVEDNLKMY
jgi:hypothetical protein